MVRLLSVVVLLYKLREHGLILGTTAIAANAVSGAITMFHLLPGLAVNAGMTTVLARCLGAGEQDQSKIFTKKIIGIILGCSTVIVLLIAVLLPEIFRLYSLEDATRKLVQPIVKWHGIFAILVWPLAYSLPVALRAAGDVKFPLHIGIEAMVLCRVIGTYLFCVYFYFGLEGAWVCPFLSWLLRAVMFVSRYKSETYLKYQVI